MSLTVKNITSGYGHTMVLWDIDFEIKSGSLTCLLGLNGAGKTTLLKTIMGVLPVRKGAIFFNGENITNQKSHVIARKGIAYAPQDSALFPELTVEENLKVAYGNKKGKFETALKQSIELFPVLEERRKQYAGTLSGGEQKMLFVARALLTSPRMMLLDEITEGLQPSVLSRLSSALKVVNQSQGTTILLIEQHIAFAASLAENYMVMRQGKIVDQGQVNQSGAKEKIESVLAL